MLTVFVAKGILKLGFNFLIEAYIEELKLILNFLLAFQWSDKILSF
jgi:hypothetical protein